jgi:hypothetical protein
MGERAFYLGSDEYDSEGFSLMLPGEAWRAIGKPPALDVMITSRHTTRQAVGPSRVSPS